MAKSKGLEVAMTVAARFGGKTVNMFVFFIVARKLSFFEMGIYGVAFSMSLILSTVLDVGIRNSLAIFIGKAPDQTGAYALQSFILWIGLSLFAPILMAISLNTSGFGVIPLEYHASSALLLIGMLYLRIMQGVLLGSGDIAMYNRSELASRVVLLILTMAFLLTEKITLASALWTLAISQAVAATYLFYHQWALIRQADGLRFDLIKALLSRGFMFMISVLMMNASKRLAFLAIGHFVDARHSGLFFALQRFTEIITEVGMAVSVVIFSHNVRAETPEEAVKGTAHSTRVCFMIFVVIAACIAISSPWSVPLLLGAKFAGNTALFQVILLATLIGSVWTILFPSLSVVSSPTKVFVLFIPGLGANILLVYPLMLQFGLLGAALSMVAANAILTGTFLAYYNRRFGIPPRDFLLPRMSDLAAGRRAFKRFAR